MSAQPSLVSITKEDGTNVILPSNSGNPIGKSGLAQFVRNNFVFGSGIYYAYFSDGSREIVGGPGSSSFGLTNIETGTLIRLAGAAPGIENVPTILVPKLIFFNSIVTGPGVVTNSGSYMLGNTQGVIKQGGLRTGSTAPGFAEETFANVVEAQIGADGWLGNLTGAAGNSFNLFWNKLGAGLDIQVNWIAITGN